MVGPEHTGPHPARESSSAPPSPTFSVVTTQSASGQARRLLLLRHGQSVWNADGRWQGRADVELSALGEAQAREAAGRLAAGDFNRLVSSNLQRARRTAEILGEALGLAVEIDPELREIDVGEWQGLTRAEIRARAPGALADWSEGRTESTPGGELRADLTERARLALLRAAAASAPGDRVLLVSHGALIRNLDRHLGLKPQGMDNLSGRWYEVAEGVLAPAELVWLADPDDRTESPTP